jgi:SAM-dependent methyltransferase
MLSGMAYTERFSDRVQDYSRYRPSYPAALLDHLQGYGLGPDASVMDVGSGTGILTELLLERGAIVHAVEPNGPMRAEAERRLGDNPRYHSVAGTAEATGLPAASVDLITAAQAFHWFDIAPTRAEWARVLRPGGWVALIWNERKKEGEFSLGYGKLANGFVDEAGQERRRLANPDAQIAAFFRHEKFSFDNHQVLDLAGVKGRALSSSFWPQSGPAFEASMQELEALFSLHQEDGLVRLDYVTEVFVGQLDQA